MVYSVLLDLPYNNYVGQLDFEEDPEIGEFAEIVPGALFVVTECSKSDARIKMRFKIIWHKFDVINALQNLGFKDEWLR